MRHLKQWLGVAGLCVAIVLSQAAPAQAGSKEGASEFITELGKQALATITGDAAAAQKRATLRSLFEKYVDIDWISKFVLGQHWRTATDEQKAQYQQYYKEFLVKNYTTNFEEFVDTTFKVTQAKEGDKPGEYILTMTLSRPNREDIRIDYRVRERNGGYRVYDFVVEGVSLLASQRSEFASVVSRKGMDYLIEQMKVKAADAGAPSRG